MPSGAEARLEFRNFRLARYPLATKSALTGYAAKCQALSKRRTFVCGFKGKAFMAILFVEANLGTEDLGAIHPNVGPLSGRASIDLG